GWRLSDELWKATDEVKAKFAEFFDLHAIIRPDGSLKDYHVDLAANVPLEIEGRNPSANDMVFSPSRGGLRGEGILSIARQRYA
ncbi:MAG: hypothetical protein PHN78_05895, partial [Dehalococcoidales bacterium]|nr:hypothetical protein [Dehalococcoidales bacterium]